MKNARQGCKKPFLESTFFKHTILFAFYNVHITCNFMFVENIFKNSLKFNFLECWGRKLSGRLSGWPRLKTNEVWWNFSAIQVIMVDPSMSRGVTVSPMSLNTLNVSLLNNSMNYGENVRKCRCLYSRYVLLREKNIILTEQRYAWEENVDYLAGEGMAIS